MEQRMKTATKFAALGFVLMFGVAACVKQTVRVSSPSGYVCVDDTKALAFSKVECKEAGMTPVDESQPPQS